MSDGRRASIPDAGYRPEPRLFTDGGQCTVRFIAEQDGRSRDFDFTAMPVSGELQIAFARAFHEHTGPAGRVKSFNAAGCTFRYLSQFCKVLSASSQPPHTAADLRPHHLDEFLLSRGPVATAAMSMGVLRALLVNVDGLAPSFVAKCAEWVPQRRERIKSLGSYSADEEKRILKAAREAIRECAKRIRETRQALTQWRSGDPELMSDEHTRRTFEVLDLVERTGEVPREADGTVQRWVGSHGTVTELTSALHLTRFEVAAFITLLVRLTGENGATIATAPAIHHRPDGGVGPIATAQLDLEKPRRGRRRYMTATLSDLPQWASAPNEQGDHTARDELHTSFGVYMLALELAASSRRITGSQRLFVYWIPKGDKGTQGRGFRDRVNAGVVGEWGQELSLLSEPRYPGSPQRLIVSVSRMRLTHLAREQRPVAHSKRTLADIYLRRDRSTLAEYQQLVAEVLTKEVDKARALGSIPQLSAADLAEAKRDPAAVAKRFDVSEQTLRLLISRDADTVLTGCVDNFNSPYSPAGGPCQASFLKCLGCPCARALPHHLPIQVAARDFLHQRRGQIGALRWAERFAVPFTQLEDLLGKAGDAATERAQGETTDDHRALVARLLNGELDQR